VAGATVDLIKDGKTVESAVTDAFGDFKFDGLLPDSGRYQIRITHASLGSAEIETSLGQTQVLGDIELKTSNMPG